MIRRAPDDYVADLRESIGLAKKMTSSSYSRPGLCPRKGIEHAIELINAGSMIHDTSWSFRTTLETRASSTATGSSSWPREKGIELLLIGDRVGEEAGNAMTRKVANEFTLWDLYPHCDLVTYPSDCEGFGNAFLEAVYFKKPVMVNRYPVYEIDIEPKGFRCAMMDRNIGEDTIREVQKLLEDERVSKKCRGSQFFRGEETLLVSSSPGTVFEIASPGAAARLEIRHLMLRSGATRKSATSRYFNSPPRNTASTSKLPVEQDHIPEQALPNLAAVEQAERPEPGSEPWSWPVPRVAGH